MCLPLSLSFYHDLLVELFDIRRCIKLVLYLYRIVLGLIRVIIDLCGLFQIIVSQMPRAFVVLDHRQLWLNRYFLTTGRVEIRSLRITFHPQIFTERWIRAREHFD